MIEGSQLRDAFISAAHNIENQKQAVDALNVFPVPDGDTGTNMSMTITAAARELGTLEDNITVAQASQTAASALLRGARGNSGVILSLLFRGFSKGLAGKHSADGTDIADALAKGVEAAYKAVMKPTEGTILTVARFAAERAKVVCKKDNDPIYVWKEIIDAAKDALDKTPEMLPVLKKAGVVDAGGKGLLVIFEGMMSVFQDGTIIESTAADQKKIAVSWDEGSRDAAAEYEGEDITFTYCTEFIVVKKEDAEDALKLRAFLESIGDSAVVVDDDEIIKCHVHTDNPGNAMQEGLKFGYLINMKIDNMREQFEKKKQGKQKKEQAAEYVPVDPDREYGFVAVAAGEGLQNIFKELGADNIVSGGQTMNPSTEDILSAIHATPAKTVFVLPNNKNIIMAAEQAIKLADRKVYVLQTRTVPQGMTAMLNFDPDADANHNQMTMTDAFEQVATGSVTFAARDSDFDGHDIKKGEILALENGKLAFVGNDLMKATVKLTRSMLKKDTAFVSVYYGSDVTEDQAAAVEEALRAKMPEDVEMTMLCGGQPVYYFLIAVE
ncbi:DAK2 domain-containing protein [Hydrogenoanaerobacterium sp.]|uniref:DAK2 domain-containing protein n=1 Tax=Hydrogenoanaerobacterium sp. TaxID=2953763 RepID=UPI00289E6993|nr:DAK2 domain-containing protein [Hydrogenoanaerobacterium sp.]